MNVEPDGDVPRESAENHVSELDAMSRDGGAETDVVLDQELGEVFEDNQENAQSALEDDAGRLVEVGCFEEGVEEFEERHQQAVEVSPSLNTIQISTIRQAGGGVTLTSLFPVCSNLGMKYRCEISEIQL